MLPVQPKCMSSRQTEANGGPFRRLDRVANSRRRLNRWEQPCRAVPDGVGGVWLAAPGRADRRLRPKRGVLPIAAPRTIPMFNPRKVPQYHSIGVWAWALESALAGEAGNTHRAAVRQRREGGRPLRVGQIQAINSASRIRPVATKALRLSSCQAERNGAALGGDRRLTRH